MKFLIDAHLPKEIAVLLSSKGHDSIHTSSLPEKNRTDDNEIYRKKIVIQ